MFIGSGNVPRWVHERHWEWFDIETSDVYTTVAAQRRQWKETTTSWPAPKHIVHVDTACGRTLVVDARAGNPSLAASAAVDSLQGGSRVRLALDGNDIIAIGSRRAVHHPEDDAILRAHGIDVDATHAWASEVDDWNDDLPNPHAGHDLVSLEADGRHTARFLVEGGRTDRLASKWGDMPTACDYAYEAGWLLVRGLPHTAATAIVGRRLRRVVSIPALDRIPLRIRAVELGEGHARLRIVSNRGWISLIH